MEGETSPCKHGTCEDKINHFICNCTGTGYRGENCEVDIDECQDPVISQSCSYPIEKECVNYPGGYKCECPKQFCGTNCSFENPCELLSSNETCGNGGVCVPKCDEDPLKW